MSTVGPAGALAYPPPTRISIAGTHVISVADGPIQWLTATADTAVTLADPGPMWTWRLTVIVDPAGHAVTLPDHTATVPLRWAADGLPAQPYGLSHYTLDWTPGLGWEAQFGGGDIS